MPKKGNYKGKSQSSNLKCKAKSAKSIETNKKNDDINAEKLIVLRAQDRINSTKNQRKSFLSRFLNMFISKHNSGVRMKYIQSHLLLGGKDDASDYASLHGEGVTHVLNVAKQIPNYFEKKFIYMHIKLEDSTTEDLTPHFNSTSQFIRRVEEINGKVLVHCVAGVSRSAGIVVAYLMKEKKMNLMQAYQLVKNNRTVVRPNEAFRFQLAKYEVALFGYTSVRKTPDKDWNFYKWNMLKESYPSV